MDTLNAGAGMGGCLPNSPFIELGCPFTYYEALKMLLLLPLVPVRLVVGGLALVIIAVVNSLVVWNWPLERPLSTWRRSVVLLSKELVLVTLWCLGFRVRVRGRENVKTAERLGAVAIFNHVASFLGGVGARMHLPADISPQQKRMVAKTNWVVAHGSFGAIRELWEISRRAGGCKSQLVSWVDAFAMVWLLAPSGVSKDSNGRIPVIGQAVRALQTVYIPYDKLSKRSRKGAAAAEGGGVTTGVGAGESATASDATVGLPSDQSGSDVDGLGVRGSDGCASIERTNSDSPQLTRGGGGGGGGGGSSSDNESSDIGSDNGSSMCSSSGSGRSSSPSPECLDAAEDPRNASAAVSRSASVHCDGESPAASDTAGEVATLPTAMKAPAPASCGAATGLPPAQVHTSTTCRKGVVQSNVTEVLLRRVNDPSYCKPGGFPMLAMAPEGTTANGRGLLNFRTGAFVLRRPILPICLRYRWRGLNPAWTIMDERWHFLRLMCQFRNDLEIEILPPYKPSEDELKDPRLFAAHVRQLMAAVLDVPLVDASHDDYLALSRLGVRVSWDGRRVVLPRGARDAVDVATQPRPTAR